MKRCPNCVLREKEIRDWKNAHYHLVETIRILAERVAVTPPPQAFPPNDELFPTRFMSTKPSERSLGEALVRRTTTGRWVRVNDVWHDLTRGPVLIEPGDTFAVYVNDTREDQSVPPTLAELVADNIDAVKSPFKIHRDGEEDHDGEQNDDD